MKKIFLFFFIFISHFAVGQNVPPLDMVLPVGNKGSLYNPPKFQIKMIKDPTDLQDVVTLNYLNTYTTSASGIFLKRSVNTYTAATTISNNASFLLSPTTLSITPTSNTIFNTGGTRADYTAGNFTFGINGNYTHTITATNGNSTISTAGSFSVNTTGLFTIASASVSISGGAFKLGGLSGLGAGKFLTTDASGNTSWGTVTIPDSWNKDGNTVVSEKFIGTIDNFSFPIRTFNTEQAKFFANGDINIGNNTNGIFYERSTGEVGVNTNNPSAQLHVKTYTTRTGIQIDTANRVVFTVNPQGMMTLGMNRVDDCMFEIANRDWATNLSMYLVAWKSKNLDTIWLRMKGDGATEFNGFMGAGITPNSAYRMYLKGYGTTAGSFPLACLNGNNENLLHMADNRGLTINGIAAQSFAQPQTVAVTGVNTTDQVLYNGTATMNVYTNDALSVGVGGSIALGGRRTSTAFYGFGAIRGAKENNTPDDGDGYLCLYTLRQASSGMVERIRITSQGGVTFSGATNYGTTGQVLTSNGNAPPTWSAPSIGTVLTGSATLNFPSTLAASSSDLTITVTGAVNGDVVSLGTPNGSVNSNTAYYAWVSGANTVTVRFINFDVALASDPASGTFKVKILQ